MALTSFLSSYCLRAKGKWRILSVQTLMLQKAFNSTSWAHMRAELSTLATPTTGDREEKRQMPLLYVYSIPREKQPLRQIQLTAVNSTKQLPLCKCFSSISNHVRYSVKFGSFVSWYKWLQGENGQRGEEQRHLQMINVIAIMELSLNLVLFFFFFL